MHRFFIPYDWINQQNAVIKDETAYQIQRVLRLKVGESIIVLDNSGDEHQVVLTSIHPDVLGQITHSNKNTSEPKVELTLYFGLSQREKVEWVLQKCTEIGVSRFIPVITSRTMVRDTKLVEEKRKRWEAILKEAAEQSGRGKIPTLEPTRQFRKAPHEAKSFDLAMIAWEGKGLETIRSILSGITPGKVALWIGPEGGFSLQEIEEAREGGWIPVTIGPRILRMETAAIAASAIVLNELN